MRHLPPFLLLLIIPFFFGCQPSTTPETEVTEQASVPPPSSVPLRIGFATELADSELLERQWLSESEQPIAITSASVDEFLEQERAAVDVVLFPSYLIGELLRRGWVVPLPSVFDSTEASTENSIAGGDSASEDRQGFAYPAVWDSQTKYGMEDYAIPLGFASPVLIASEPMAMRLQEEMPGMKVSWDALTGLFERDESDTDAGDTATGVSEAGDAVSPENVDHSALVDRFLYLAANFSIRNLKYGLLFETKSLTCELRGDEFQKAAEVLVLLSEQPGGLESVLGSHSSVWKWASDNENAVVALASPALLTADASAITTGQALAMSDALPWNLGGGIVAAIAGDCRQTSQANVFLRWLSQASTRNALQPLLPGVQGDGRNIAPDSLVSRANDLLRENASENQKASEPRLPGAHDYRRILGEHLYSIITKEVAVEAGLDAAATEIDALSKQLGTSQVTEYKRSLGLIE